MHQFDVNCIPLELQARSVRQQLSSMTIEVCNHHKVQIPPTLGARISREMRARSSISVYRQGFCRFLSSCLWETLRGARCSPRKVQDEEAPAWLRSTRLRFYSGRANVMKTPWITSLGMQRCTAEQCQCNHETLWIGSPNNSSVCMSLVQNVYACRPPPPTRAKIQVYFSCGEAS